MAKGPHSIATHKTVPRTVAEADVHKHAKVPMPSAKDMAGGTHMSVQGAQVGDVAYVGPCEAGTRIVCYYDQNLDPSDCRNQPC
jgi:hypothetical protein